MRVNVIRENEDGSFLYAKAACKKCFGRGFVGTIKGFGVRCKCLFAGKPLDKKAEKV